MTNPTVLLVDDSRVARLMTRSVIEAARPGWTIVEATTGDEALEMAAKSPVDFVLMDVNMPGMNGLEAARLFRQRFPAAALSLLTANIQDSVCDEAAGLGIGYIAKPLKDDVLLAFLNARDGAP
jgi:CheY-like chemotaxis protein